MGILSEAIYTHSTVITELVRDSAWLHVQSLGPRAGVGVVLTVRHRGDSPRDTRPLPVLA